MKKYLSLILSLVILVNGFFLDRANASLTLLPLPSDWGDYSGSEFSLRLKRVDELYSLQSSRVLEKPLGYTVPGVDNENDNVIFWETQRALEKLFEQYHADNNKLSDADKKSLKRRRDAFLEFINISKVRLSNLDQLKISKEYQKTIVEISELDNYDLRMIDYEVILVQNFIVFLDGILFYSILLDFYQKDLPPVIESISPNPAIVSNGDIITVMGKNFNLDTKLYIDDSYSFVTAFYDVDFISSNEVRFKVPAINSQSQGFPSEIVRTFTLINKFQEDPSMSSSFTFRGKKPEVIGVLPNIVKPGQKVKVKLKGMYNVSLYDAKVTVGGSPVPILNNKDAFIGDEIEVMIPREFQSPGQKLDVIVSNTQFGSSANTTLDDVYIEGAVIGDCKCPSGQVWIDRMKQCFNVNVSAANCSRYGNTPVCGCGVTYQNRCYALIDGVKNIVPGSCQP